MLYLMIKLAHEQVVVVKVTRVMVDLLGDADHAVDYSVQTVRQW